MKVIAPLAGGAHVIGLTGSPGVGKSTVTGALVRGYRVAGQRVGVLAVDPTSPFSGGALLGDRVRMQDHATDDGVFIRSMASRGHLGGLAWATPQALRILDAAGFDVILIETVGVGQAEVEIAATADTTLVVVAPGMGDSIQAAKAGILEIADAFAVNKSDRPGAQEVVRDLRTMLAMARYGPDDWKPPIVSTTAGTGDGIADLAAALGSHLAWLEKSGERAARRQARARDEITAIAVAELPAPPRRPPRRGPPGGPGRPRGRRRPGPLLRRRRPHHRLTRRRRAPPAVPGGLHSSSRATRRARTRPAGRRSVPPDPSAPPVPRGHDRGKVAHLRM